MPAPPELDDAIRLVGRVEVDGQRDAEQQRETDCHVGVAGKVEVDLEGVAECRGPRLDECQMVAGRHCAERDRHELREAVREDDLLDESDAEYGDTLRDQQRLRPQDVPARELWHQLRVAHDRTGEQMRKEGNTRGITQRAGPPPAMSIGIHEKHDLLEGKERDPQRQRRANLGHRPAEERGQVHRGEPGVLVVAEKKKIRGDACRGQPPPPAVRARALDRQRQRVVQRDRYDQERQIRRVPPGVEKQRCGEEPRQRGPSPP